MPKRLVMLRDRSFRYVSNLPPASQPGPGIQWSSCNSTMTGGGGGGGSGAGGADKKPVWQTATGVSMLGWQYQQTGGGLVQSGLRFAAGILGTNMILPAFALGAGIRYGVTQVVAFSRPCSESDIEGEKDSKGVTF